MSFRHFSLFESTIHFRQTKNLFPFLEFEPGPAQMIRYMVCQLVPLTPWKLGHPLLFKVRRMYIFLKHNQVQIVQWLSAQRGTGLISAHRQYEH